MSAAAATLLAPAAPGQTLPAGAAYPQTPAPGTIQVRLRAAPRREPPFDDELDATPADQLDQPLPLPLRVVPPMPPPRTPQTPTAQLRTPQTRPHLAPHSDPGLPEPEGWGRRLLLGLQEVAAGHRPMTQLADLLAPAVTASLAAEFTRVARTRQRHWTCAARVRSVHVTRPRAGVAEVCATAEAQYRLRAIALRLEARHGRWICTHLQFG